MSSRLVMWFSARVVVIAGAIVVLGAMLYGSTLHRGVPYFPNLVLPIVVGAIGMGVINVPLGLSLIASVDSDRIGPAAAIALMLQILDGPVVLVGIQAVITSRTLQLVVMVVSSSGVMRRAFAYVVCRGGRGGGGRR